MSDQNNNQENIDENANNEQHSENNANELQQKIDSAVKARVAREKEQQKLMQQQWEEEKKLLEEENKFLKEQFQAKIDEQLEELTPSFRSLVSKLSIQDQIKWLAEYNADKEKQPKVPPIPNFDKKQSNKGGEIEHLPIDRIA